MGLDKNYNTIKDYDIIVPSIADSISSKVIESDQNSVKLTKKKSS